MRLKDKIAIITGAASGIGRATAILFAKEGAKVLVVDLSEEKGNEVVEIIKSQRGEGIFLKADVSRTEEAEKVVKTCLENFGKIDILINNAGIVRFAPLHETPEEDWNKVIDINLKSVFLCSKAVIPQMLKQGKGKIVNNASIAGLVGFENIGPYCASKGGIIALTKEMALEYARYKINVNCVAPGVIKTAMTKDMLADPKTREFLEQNTLYPRLGEPEDIANAFLYLSSDESDFVNGEVLVVDGGWISK